MSKIILEAHIKTRDSVGALTQTFKAEFPPSDFQFAIAAHDQACADGHEAVRLYLVDESGVQMPMRNQIDWQRIQRFQKAACESNTHGPAHVIAGPFSGPKERAN